MKTHMAQVMYNRILQMYRSTLAVLGWYENSALKERFSLLMGLFCFNVNGSLAQ